MEHPIVSKKERSPSLEIERKYLLASESDAKRFEEKIKQLFPEARLVGGYPEASYYFPRVNKEKARQLLTLVTKDREEGPELLAKLDEVPESMPIAIRLRRRKNLEDKTFIFTLKASPDPLHDVERLEIETDDINDGFLEGFAANGVEPESVWDSNRRIYAIGDDTRVEVQNVTGYGYTAEIESDDLNKVQKVAGKLDLQPLIQEVLNAMYEQYSKSWQRYYNGEGEDRHFNKDDWTEIEGKSKEDIVINQVE